MPASEGPDPDPLPDEEGQVIEAFAVRAGRMPGLRVGIGDDAALFADGRVLTVDTMVEGVHWDDKLSAVDVGWKLVAVNVSDVAAMGGRPEWALLALSLPAPLDRAWLAGFRDGLLAACARWGVTLVGGDTTRSPVRVASLTVGGYAAHPVLRSGGRPGDDLWVTGELGRAAEGFLHPAPRPAARAWLQRPEPRVAFARALAEEGLPTAMMDLSDGLRTDLGRMCVASGCGAEVDAAAVPGDGPFAWRVAFGEDYELLFAAPADRRDAVRSLATMHEISVTRVGCLQAHPGVRLVGGEAWPPVLFTHFAPRGRSRAPSTRGAP